MKTLRQSPFLSSDLRWLAAMLGCLGLLAGCATPNASSPAPGNAAAAAEKPAEVYTVQEGDVLKVSFPGAATLDSQQQVRRDGKITLPMIGEVAVAGLTLPALEKDLLDRYASQLATKEVTVTVVSSSYSVFVSGAVLRPGKISPDKPITALEAIMEAGGFDTTKANSAAVVVIRREGAQTKNYTLDLKSVLEGKSNETFYLRSSDIVYVPEKFTWF
jgi:polysaccharide export outer membrane protein